MSLLSNGPFNHNRFSALDELYAQEKQYFTEKKKAKPDFLDVDKDGNEKESFKKALKDKEDKKDDKKEVKEGKCTPGCDCKECDDKKKEMKEHMDQLVQEGYDLSGFEYDELFETYVEEGVGAFMKKVTGQEAREKKALINKTFRYSTPRGGDGKKFSDKNDPRKNVKGVTVKKKAVKEWIEALVDEGYDLSEYNMEQMEEMFDQTMAELQEEEQQEMTIEEAVMQYLMDNGFANNPVSAEVVYANMSEQWRDDVVNQLKG